MAHKPSLEHAGRQRLGELRVAGDALHRLEGMSYA